MIAYIKRCNMPKMTFPGRRRHQGSVFEIHVIGSTTGKGGLPDHNYRNVSSYRGELGYMSVE